MINLPYKKQLSNLSLIKYKGKAPSVEKVKEILKQSGLSKDRFEIVYGIADKTIERYVLGHRGLPVSCWHIFYEFDHLEKFYATFNTKRIKQIKETSKKIDAPHIAEKNKSLIDAYRRKFS